MSRFDLPVFATLGLVIGPVLFAKSFRYLRTRRLIENTPTSRIRSLAMGLAEIKGRVEARSAVEAPFSGKPCAYWQVEVAVRGRRNSWSTVHRNASGNPFFVQDETGVAMVYPAGSQCTVPHAMEDQCFGLAMPDCYSRYLAEQRIFWRHLWRFSMLRFRERLIQGGEPVYVLGTALPRSNSRDLSLGGFAAVEDTPGTATRGARIRGMQDQVSAVIRKGENEPTFIISQEHEQSVAMGFGLKALGGLVGGPILTLLGLGYWLYSLPQARALP